MASTINAKNTSTGVVITPDASGQLELQTADTTRMTITSSGDVGIGTSSPNVALDVRRSSGEAVVGVTNSGTGSAWVTFSPGSLGGAYIHNVTASPTIFTTNGTERMRIDSSGNVGINTTNSGADRLSIYFVKTGQQGIKIQQNTDTGGGNAVLFANAANTTIGTIGTSSTNTSYNTSSDYRLKENIAPMTGALDKVTLLKPVTYNWKIDGSDGQGFIAHELQEVVPDCVTGEKDAVDEEGNPKYQGVDTSFLVATLTAAIQELKAELDTVKAELAELKGAA